LKIGQEINLYYIHCLETKKIHNLEPMSHGMMHIVNYMVEFLKLNIYSITKCHNKINKIIQLIQNLKNYIQLVFGMITQAIK